MYVHINYKDNLYAKMYNVSTWPDCGVHLFWELLRNSLRTLELIIKVQYCNATNCSLESQKYQKLMKIAFFKLIFSDRMETKNFSRNHSNDIILLNKQTSSS